MNRIWKSRAVAPLVAATALLTTLAAGTPARAADWHHHMALVRQHRYEAEHRARLAWHRHMAHLANLHNDRYHREHEARLYRHWRAEHEH